MNRVAWMAGQEVSRMVFLEDAVATVRKIQAGDDELRERFIEDSVPFIRYAVRRQVHRYFLDSDDEFAIALEAFNQAINHYRSDRNASFQSYATLVIRNRVIDWLRHNHHERSFVSMSSPILEDGQTLQDCLADPDSEIVQQNLEFAESMIYLEAQLHEFGMDLQGLTSHFPKHQDCRLMCIRIARQLSSDHELYVQLLQNHRLPCQTLARLCQIPAKTVEKNRCSIIFLALLMQSDLQIINRYITVFERACS